MLIKCTECGKEFSNKATACPNCACPVSAMEYENIQINDPEEDITSGNDDCTDVPVEPITIGQSVSREQIEEWKKKKKTFDYLMWGSIVLAIIGLVFPTLLIVFGILAIVFYSCGKDYANKIYKESDYYKNKQKEIASKTLMNVCPNCSSANIQAQMVQTGSITSKQKARHSVNINPLRPFTFSNTKIEPARTTNTYGTRFICNNCGNIFVKPNQKYL